MAGKTAGNQVIGSVQQSLPGSFYPYTNEGNQISVLSVAFVTGIEGWGTPAQAIEGTINSLMSLLATENGVANCPSVLVFYVLPSYVDASGVWVATIGYCFSPQDMSNEKTDPVEGGWILVHGEI